MRPRSLPCISRSPHPPLMARARSLYAPFTRAAAAVLVLQSVRPDSSSQLAIEQIEGSCPKAAKVLEEAEADAPKHAYEGAPPSIWPGSSHPSWPTTRFPAGRRRDMSLNDGILGNTRFPRQPAATLENRALHQHSERCRS